MVRQSTLALSREERRSGHYVFTRLGSNRHANQSSMKAAAVPLLLVSLTLLVRNHCFIALAFVPSPASPFTRKGGRGRGCGRPNNWNTGSKLPVPLQNGKNDCNDSSTRCNNTYDISIEYCTGCRWMMRAAWMAQELLTTFQDEYHLDRVTLIPSTKRPPFHPGGIFTVRAATVTSSTPGRTGTILPDVPDAVVRVLWERKSDGGFPESKVLKQRVRDIVAPKQSLGHSDANAMIADGVLIPQLETKEQLETTCEDCPPNIGLPVASVPSASAIFLETDEREDPMEVEVEVEAAIQKNVEIVYCAKSQWLLRASWMAQELLLLNLDTATTTIPPLSAATDEREEHVPPQVHYTVALVPSRSPAPEGTFLVYLNGNLLWDKTKMDGLFPEVKVLQHMILREEVGVRPHFEQDDNNNHARRRRQVPKEGQDHMEKEGAAAAEPVVAFQEMSDEEAEDMRSFFGVV